MIKIDTNKYKALLFDMDGTLINSEPLHYQSAANTLAEFGKEYLTFEDHKKTYTGTGLQHTFTKESEKHGLNVSVEELKNKFHEHLEKIVQQGGLPTIEGTTDFLDSLKNKDVKMAIVSGSTEKLIYYSLEKSGIPNVFDAIVGIEKYQNPKPDPACYRMTAEILGVSPKDCLVFEDAFNGIKSAVDAGMDVVVVGETITGERINKINPNLPHIKDFTEIEII